MSHLLRHNPEPVFPLEIFKEIIDCYAPHSPILEEMQRNSSQKSTLHALALVCRSFCHFSRIHIFRNVAFDMRFPAKESGQNKFRLCALLHQRPTLRAYIRHIFYIEQAMDSGQMSSRPRFEGTLDVLLQLDNLESLRIDGNSSSASENRSEDPIANQLGHRLLTHYLPIGRIIWLDLKCLNHLPAFLILTCPSLHYLELCACTFAGWKGQPQPRHVESQFNLKRLNEVASSTGSIAELLPYFSKLEDVSWETSTGHGFHIDTIFPMQQKPPTSLNSLSRVKMSGKNWTLWTNICSRAELSGQKAFPRVKTLYFDVTSLSFSSLALLGPNKVISHFPALEDISISVQGDQELGPLKLFIANNCDTLRSINLNWRYATDVEDCIRLLPDLLARGTVLQFLKLRLSIRWPSYIDLNEAKAPTNTWCQMTELLMSNESPLLHLKELTISVEAKWGMELFLVTNSTRKFLRFEK